jgi:hypothetical protein
MACETCARSGFLREGQLLTPLGNSITREGFRIHLSLDSRVTEVSIWQNKQEQRHNGQQCCSARDSRLSFRRNGTESQQQILGRKRNLKPGREKWSFSTSLESSLDSQSERSSSKPSPGTSSDPDSSVSTGNPSGYADSIVASSAGWWMDSEPAWSVSTSSHEKTTILKDIRDAYQRLASHIKVASEVFWRSRRSRLDPVHYRRRRAKHGGVHLVKNQKAASDEVEVLQWAEKRNGRLFLVKTKKKSSSGYSGSFVRQS